MASIDLDLAHSYKPNPTTDADYALLPMKLRFDDGGAYALLGPSGCGKTTLLNIISGLVIPSKGTVKYDGIDVSKKSPQERNIAQVFQFPVIYDTMTVAENLAFPLRNRGVDAAAIAKRVDTIAQLLELTADLNRRASGLTADAKQKISLGRGLVRSDVSAVLFDEPLTVIDPHLKWQLRRKLKQIHSELKLTLIYVTHDQVEALTFAQKVVVMSEGKVLQTDSADGLFERPAHTFVGHFIGSPGMNFLPCNWRDGKLMVHDKVIEHQLSAALQNQLAAAGQFELGIRPESALPCAPNTIGAVPIVLDRAQDVGTHILLTGKVGDSVFRARLGSDQPLPAVGQTQWFNVLDEHTCFYQNGERMI
jgi:glycerol transport system ATP-binding protein